MGRVGIAWFAGLSLLASLSSAAPSKGKAHGFALSGTVASVDESKKTFVVKNSAGKETTLIWTDATTMSGGALKPGERVTLRYLDRDRKHIATSVRIGAAVAKKASAPATPAAAAARPTAPPESH